MVAQDKTTLELLDRAAVGDVAAGAELLARHRGRLRRMIAVHIDRRLTARFDPSDVVQEALFDAAQELPEYLRRRPIPFYSVATPYRLGKAGRPAPPPHRAQSRSVQREEPRAFQLPDESVLELADRLIARGGSPIANMVRQEERAEVRLALTKLGDRDRDILILRHLEQLSIAEIAGVLNIREGAVKTRLLRALVRFRELLTQVGTEV